MTIEENKTFSKSVLYLPDSESGGRKTPGAELVGMSRAKELICLAIGHESKNLSIQDIQKIGSTKSCNLRREFESIEKKKLQTHKHRLLKP